MAGRQLGTIIRHLHQVVSPEQRAGLPDAQLLERFAEQRDEAAFEVLLWRHGPMVLGLCRRLLRHTQDAEDAFQATFLALVRKARSISKREAVGSWLYKVAYRVALEAKARAARRVSRELPVENLAAPEPADALVWRDLRPVLDEELNRLPDKYRAPFVLCCLEGKTQEETAQELHWPKGTVSTRLTRARELLRTRLARRGLALSAGTLVTGLSPRAAPAALVDATLRAAWQFATGRTAADGPASAVALAERALATLFVSRLKTAALVLALCLLTVGLGWTAHRALAGKMPETEQADLLGQTEQAKPKEDRADRHGDLLPAGAVARLGTVRFRHPNLVYATAFAPDGKAIATGCFDGTVRLWDATTGQELRRLHRPSSLTEVFFSGQQSWPWIYSIALSPDGRTVVASGTHGLVCLWELSTGRLLRQFQGHRVTVRKVAFSPDGQAIASASDDGTVRLWQPATGQELRRFQGRPRETPWCVAFAPDGKTLATGGDLGALALWDVATGTELCRCHGHKGVVESVSFSPDGRTFVSGGHDATVREWEVASGRELRRFGPPAGEVWSVTFSPDGNQLAAMAKSGHIHVWQAATARETCRLPIHWRTAGASLVFSPDGKTLALGDGCTIGLWDVASGRSLQPPRGHRGTVFSVAFSPDGKKLASGSFDRTLGLWDPATGEQVGRLAGHGEAVHAVTFERQGRYLASASSDETIRLWELPSGQLLHQLPAYTDARRSVVFSPDGKTLASQGGDGLAHLWDVETGRELARLQGKQDFVVGLALSPDGALLASAGRVPAASPGQSPSWTVALWSVAARREVRHLEGHRESVEAVAFSPRGNVLASASLDGTVRLWETATGQERCRFQVPREQTAAVAFSPNGRLLAAGGPDSTIRLWDVVTGERRGRFTGQQGGVRCLAFSPNGRTLAAGGSDTTILLWDVGTFSQPKPGRETALSREEFESLWTELARADPARGHRALVRLAAASEEAVPFLNQRLRPVPAPERQRITRLIADLDDERFSTRERATSELRDLDELAVPVLQEAHRRSSLEAARRIRQILEQQEAAGPAPENLRALRAVELLEHLGTAEARQVLEALARGAPAARQTQAAKAALDRLGSGSPSGP